MPAVENFTNPLSGIEVLDDICGQIRRRLASDCNMRGTDGYSGGYTGTVTVKLKLHAVRISEVEMEIPIIAPPTAPAPESFPSESLDLIEIDEHIEIPLEPNLTAVRERTIENKAENIEHETAAPEDEENMVAPRTKRKYTRRVPSLAGAVAEPVF